jgi:hypothetical protein
MERLNPPGDEAVLVESSLEETAALVADSLPYRFSRLLGEYPSSYSSLPL